MAFHHYTGIRVAANTDVLVWLDLDFIGVDKDVAVLHSEHVEDQ